MSILYKVVGILPPGKKEEEKAYYPRIAKRQKADLHDIARSISQATTFHKADVFGVLEAFTNYIPQLLSDNFSVELGDLGTFSLHISAEGSEVPEKVSRHKIKGVTMAFRPSPRVKRDLKYLKFKKIPENKG
jgi:predicted histone-like DNA-binding protein